MFVSTLTEINLVLKGGISHRLSSTKTLKLKSGYKVKYEANAPSGCNASINLEETYYAYDTVKFTNQTLECDGYQFKGWESVQKVKKVNDDNFIMPSNDVIIRGTWSKVTLNKSMQGKIYERLSLYDTIALTSYLEDTVWCNDRTIYKLGGWEANGGSTRDSSLYFGVYGRIIKSNPSLSCRKIHLILEVYLLYFFHHFLLIFTSKILLTYLHYNLFIVLILSHKDYLGFHYPLYILYQVLVKL